MARAWWLVLLVAVALARASYVDEAFRQFINDNGRSYAPGEYAERLVVFNATLRRIEEQNAQLRSAGSTTEHFHIGPFADLTEEEFERFVFEGVVPSFVSFTPALVGRRPWSNRYKEWFSVQNFTTIGEDWSLWLPVAKHQESCGACYAFAAIALVEFEAGRAADMHTELSEQALIECYGSCEGGSPYEALEWIQRHGVPPAESNPYNPKDLRPCAFSSAQPRATIGRYFEVEQRNIDKELLKRPVLVRLKITPAWHSLRVYPQSSLEPPIVSFKPTNGHSVVIVGTAKSPQHEEYYIIRNSWGSLWGVEGHALLPKKYPFYQAYAVDGFSWRGNVDQPRNEVL